MVWWRLQELGFGSVESDDFRYSSGHLKKVPSQELGKKFS